IDLIPFLKRLDELIVPSWPVPEITTGSVEPLCVVTPYTLPIQVVLLTSSPQTSAPIQITPFAVPMLKPASLPNAMFPLPALLLASAAAPMAVLQFPPL